MQVSNHKNQALFYVVLINNSVPEQTLTLVHEMKGEWERTTILAHVVNKWSLIFQHTYLHTFI